MDRIAFRIILFGVIVAASTILRAAEPSQDLDRVRRQLAQTRQEIERYQSEEESLQQELATIQSR
jgi:septal ring factor EnvC (AmiA/AmiB activator)